MHYTRPWTVAFDGPTITEAVPTGPPVATETFPVAGPFSQMYFDYLHEGQPIVLRVYAIDYYDSPSAARAFTWATTEEAA